MGTDLRSHTKLTRRCERVLLAPPRSLSPKMGCTSGKDRDSTQNFGGDIRRNDAPFPTQIVGTFSNHGIEMKYETVAKTNQDMGSIEYPFLDDPNGALFCVMDGHGPHGDQVSQFCTSKLHEVLPEYYEGLMSMDPTSTLVQAFSRISGELSKAVNVQTSGSTCVALHVRGEGRRKQLWMANLGDSRAVLGSMREGRMVALDLTNDQKPDSEGEQPRIERCGGVEEPPIEEGLSARVWTPDLLYGLSMARSLGDEVLTQYGVSAIPEVTTHQTEECDKYLIIASDGIWEFISSQEAISIIDAHPDDATQGCRDLIEHATLRWREEEGAYRDDITAIVVHMDALVEFMNLQQLMNKTAVDGPESQQPSNHPDPDAPPTESNWSISKPSKQEAVETHEVEKTSEQHSASKPHSESFRRRRLSNVGADAKRDEPDEPADVPSKPVRQRISFSEDMDHTGRSAA